MKTTPRTMDSMLSLYRRHTSKCAHRRKGSGYLKCGCPVWCWGALPSGKFIRRSVSTRNMSAARRTVECWERNENPDKPPSLARATELFLAMHADSSQATQVKYAKIMRLFREFSERWGYAHLDQVTVETFDRYRETRDVAPLTWSKELQVLRSFCEFCVRRKWLQRNLAREVEMPRGIKSADREPYTEAEMVSMLQACEVIGQKPYERLRARALVLVMRYTGLSIGSAFMLRRDALREGYVEVRRAKNGKPVKVPVALDLTAALEAVPVPCGAEPDCPYYFFAPGRDPDGAVRRAIRTMAAVFRRAGIRNGKTHRFRHTLATRMVENGASFEDVAAVLGNSARIVEKHYAKWSKGRQERIDRYFRAAHGRQEETGVVH